MKKKKMNSLSLNKKIISNLQATKVLGGDHTSICTIMTQCRCPRPTHTCPPISQQDTCGCPLPETIIDCPSINE